MKKIALLLLLITRTILLPAQTESPNLLGECKINDLKNPPYAEWFTDNYANYTPNTQVITQIKSEDLSRITVTAFFGTWCEDSQREIPRFLKIIESLGTTPQLRLIALGNGNADSLYRQSPDHEEVGQHIYRVPTIIITDGENELGRIVEYPAVSLERDLLDIIRGLYIPNYSSFLYIASWLDEGILDDVNISHKGLTNQIRPLVTSPSELNSIASLLLRREKINPAAASTILRINRNLYPDTYWTYTRLAEALSTNESKHLEATEILQEGLEHIKDEADRRRIQELLDTILSRIE
jgi:hypothetical protein